MTLQGMKVLYLVAADFEDLEFWVPIMRLQEEAAQVVIAGLSAQESFLGKYGIPASSQIVFEAVDPKDYDAVFIGTGAPRGKDLPKLPGRWDAEKHVHIGINWLASVAFGHTEKIGKKVIVVGGGNTAMDASRVALRLQKLKGYPLNTTVIYRRTEVEMPARRLEI